MFINDPYFQVFNTIMNWVIGLLGSGLAYYFYLKTRRKISLVYFQRSQLIIENSNPILNKITVHYDGMPQSRIVVTYISLWNNGNATIKKSEIVRYYNFGIKIPDNIDIMDYLIVKEVTKSNEFEIQNSIQDVDGNSVLPISFDYIDPGDGILIQIVHNGFSSSSIHFSGKIMGLKEIARIDYLHWNFNDSMSELSNRIGVNKVILKIISFMFIIIFSNFLLLTVLKIIIVGLSWFAIIPFLGFIIFCLILRQLFLDIKMPITLIPPEIVGGE